MAASLRQWVSEGHAEVNVVMAFLHALTQSATGECFGRALRRVILKGWKQVAPGEVLDRDVTAALKDVTADAWHWLPVARLAESRP